MLERFHPLSRISSVKGVICLLSEALSGSYEGHISALSATQAEIIARNAYYQHLLTVKAYKNPAIFLSGASAKFDTMEHTLLGGAANAAIYPHPSSSTP